MATLPPGSPQDVEDESMVDELAQETATPEPLALVDPATPGAGEDMNPMDVDGANGQDNGRSRSSSSAAMELESGSGSGSATTPTMDMSQGGGGKRGRAVRKHFNDRFSEKTNKFRLTGYVNDPNASAITSPDNPTPGAQPDVSFMVQDGVPVHQPNGPPPPGGVPMHPGMPPQHETTFSPYDPHAPTLRRPRRGGPEEPYTGSQPPFTYNPAVNRNAPPGVSPGPYDGPDQPYDWGVQPNHAPPPPTGTFPPETRRANAYLSHAGAGPPAPPFHTQAGPPPPPPQAQSMAPRTRVVNVLIKDQRGDADEDQYAEVRVPLGPAESDKSGRSQGWWADAKAVVDALQAGPGRIDGPAKVYTMRGKFKQYFLRVSEDNVDQCSSANLLISPAKVLEITVTHVSASQQRYDDDGTN
jgi:hypothetical protein